ncbi:MAG: hypothetical protein V8Q54_02875 [Alistipes senegalensis]
METLIFPCGGRRDATGTVVESNNAAFYWSRSMFTGGDNNVPKTATTYASDCSISVRQAVIRSSTLRLSARPRFMPTPRTSATAIRRCRSAAWKEK